MASLFDSKHQENFYPFLKEYPHTFSGRKNVSTEELNNTMKQIDAKDKNEAILTRKMDGIAMLCAIGIKKSLKSEAETDEDCVFLDYSKLGSVGVENQAWNTKLVKLWLNPRNMFTIREFEGEFYKISLQLFKPTHHDKALNLPHLFRMCVEDRLFELVKRMPKFDDKIAKGVTMVYRSEFMVGNEGWSKLFATTTS